MPRKTMNICGHCNEHKATDACVICDTDLCEKHARYVKWVSYLVSQNGDEQEKERPDATHKHGPLCPRCYEANRWKMKHPSYDHQFRNRVKVATQNVANAIAREMFRGRKGDDT